MQKIGIIGVGNAGGQVAALAKRLFGVPGIAINTSKDDVSTLKDIIPVLTVGDERGAGKDRDIAKLFLRDRIREVVTQEELANVVNSSTLIFIPGSTGGGTGSAFAPVLTQVLTSFYPTKKFIPVGILPPLNESVGAQQNSLDYLREIAESSPTFMLYDNEKYISQPRTRSELFARMNQEIVEDLIVVRGDYQFTTTSTSIDERDSTKIVHTPGRLVVGQVQGIHEKDVDSQSIENRLISAIKNSAHAELDYDQIIKRFGLIINLNEKLHKTFDPSIPTFKEVFGEPLEEFEHFYVNQSNDTNRVAVLMSGLSMPDDRVEKIVQRIAEVEAQFMRKKESAILGVDTGFIRELRNEGETKRVSPVEDLTNIFDKFM